MHTKLLCIRAGGRDLYCGPNSQYRADGCMLDEPGHPHTHTFYTVVVGQLGGRHSFFSAFRAEQKSVLPDPSQTHVPLSHEKKKYCQCNCEAIIFQQRHLFKVKVGGNPPQHDQGNSAGPWMFYCNFMCS